MEQQLYYAYSDYLKEKYGEKVYKLPVNLPVTCPNRINGNQGCVFCSDVGTGFESLDATTSVKEQLLLNKDKIARRYHARKFIAYFQNYTNTFLPLATLCRYITEAAMVPDIVEIAISTRPDCIRQDYLEAIRQLSNQYQIEITFELGLQTANYRTLKAIERGHGLAEYIDAVLQLKQFKFDCCTHVILNLPTDDIIDCIETAKILSALNVSMVKLHSLYIAKNTLLCEAYENGTITICSKEEYLKRVIAFLEHIPPNMAVERLFSRIPKEDSIFSNWGTSWWKLRDELLQIMVEEHHFQGKHSNYLNGAALRLL